MMASISRQPGGRRTIQFIGRDNRHRSVRLGKMSQRTAEAVKVRVEQLVAASITGHATDDETALWLVGLDSVLYDRLAAVQLVPKRHGVMLAAFIDAYVDSRDDVKPATATVYGHTRRCLVAFFGDDKPLRDITPGDADLWRLGLIRSGLADNDVKARWALNALMESDSVQHLSLCDIESDIGATLAAKPRKVRST